MRRNSRVEPSNGVAVSDEASQYDVADVNNSQESKNQSARNLRKSSRVLGINVIDSNKEASAICKFSVTNLTSCDVIVTPSSTIGRKENVTMMTSSSASQPRRKRVPHALVQFFTRRQTPNAHVNLTGEATERTSEHSTIKVLQTDPVKDERKQETDKLKEEEEVEKRRMSTVMQGVLSTAGFIWVPRLLCSSSISRCNSDEDAEGNRVASEMMTEDDRRLSEAALCARWRDRRNALCDHMQSTLPQETRERIEKDVADRRTSLTRKVSQYFRSIYSSDYEIDL